MSATKSAFLSWTGLAIFFFPLCSEAGGLEEVVHGNLVTGDQEVFVILEVFVYDFTLCVVDVLFDVLRLLLL